MVIEKLKGDIRVFYKLFRGDGDDDESKLYSIQWKWTYLIKTVNPNALRNAFSEYKFTVENTAQFNWIYD